MQKTRAITMYSEQWYGRMMQHEVLQVLVALFKQKERDDIDKALQKILA